GALPHLRRSAFLVLAVGSVRLLRATSTGALRLLQTGRSGGADGVRAQLLAQRLVELDLAPELLGRREPAHPVGVHRVVLPGHGDELYVVEADLLDVEGQTR